MALSIQNATVKSFSAGKSLLSLLIAVCTLSVQAAAYWVANDGEATGLNQEEPNNAGCNRDIPMHSGGER